MNDSLIEKEIIRIMKEWGLGTEEINNETLVCTMKCLVCDKQRLKLGSMRSSDSV